MPTQEEEDKDAKRRAREERRKPSSSTRRESTDRREKDRVRKERDSQAYSTPGAYASTDSARSKSGKRSSDRSDRHSPSRSSNAKSRTSKSASVPGAVSSSTASPHSRRERRKAGAGDTSSRSTPNAESSKSRSSGKSRTSRAATSPGAVTSTLSPQSRKERRKTAAGDAAIRSSNIRSNTSARNNPDAVQKKLQAAGLFDEEDIAMETPSKTMEATEEGGEILLQATTVDENEESKPKMRDVELIVGDAPAETEEPPPQEPKKRRYGIIVLFALILGAGAAAGAYFGTRGSSNPKVVPSMTLSPTIAENITLTPTTSPPTDPPTQSFKYPPPNDDDCQRIASGLDREPKADDVSNYELTMEVELADQENQLVLAYLEERMQEMFIPALAGCSDVVVRQPNIRYVIYNGLVSLSLTRRRMQGASCVLDHTGPCYVVLASISLELQGKEVSRSIESIIDDVLGLGQEDNLVPKWQLEYPITRVSVIDIESINLAESPSEKPTSISSPPPTVAPSFLFSENPTRAPVSGTRSPTVEPSSLPSVAPTTSAPTVAASENPTLAPVVGPTTEEPTDLPSSGPSGMPSRNPTVPPTPLPSLSPSLDPSISPSLSPTTMSPSLEPSVIPSSLPTLEPFDGDHLENSHYVYYMPEPPNAPENPYNSREEAQTACETKGLELCSKSAITSFPLCSIGWLTDGRGLWSDGQGCGSGGYNDGDFFGISDRGGAYCCGRPYYMPDDRTGQGYIYSSREEALAACQSIGRGLCSREQITGFSKCRRGWLSDTIGYWMDGVYPGCGPGGFVDNRGATWAGTYCCVERPVTEAPSVAPSVMPSSRPTFELMEGDHLQNEHYVYYMPDNPGAPEYPYLSREAAQDACETKGLTICSISAITNFPLCSIGWLTDGRGLWSDGQGCGSGGYTDGDFFGISDRGGAYCCGRPYYMPDDRTGQGYIYSSREEALAACQSIGRGLCSREQITGFSKCRRGWLSDTIGYWMDGVYPGCGPGGFVDNRGAAWAGTYCCTPPP